jgi:four helix bundle protein
MAARSAVRYYRDLKTWQKAMDLAVESYRLTARMPRREIYGLSSQITRAAGSVPANIAEGNGRFSRGEYINQLSVAHGSLMELETHVELAARLEYLTEAARDAFFTRSGEVSAMLLALRNGLRGSAPLR